MPFILQLGLQTAYCRFFCGKCRMGDKSFSCTAGRVHSSMCEKRSCKQVLVSVTLLCRKEALTGDTLLLTKTPEN